MECATCKLETGQFSGGGNLPPGFHCPTCTACHEGGYRTENERLEPFTDEEAGELIGQGRPLQKCGIHSRWFLTVCFDCHPEALSKVACDAETVIGGLLVACGNPLDHDGPHGWEGLSQTTLEEMARASSHIEGDRLVVAHYATEI